MRRGALRFRNSRFSCCTVFSSWTLVQGTVRMRLATVYSFWLRLLAAPIRGRVFRAGVRVWGVGCVHLQELLINDCHEGGRCECLPQERRRNSCSASSLAPSCWREPYKGSRNLKFAQSGDVRFGAFGLQDCFGLRVAVGLMVWGIEKPLWM